MDCLVLNLTVYIRNVIFFYKKQTHGESSYSELFRVILNFGLYYTANRLFLNSTMIVTSYLKCWYLFLYMGREELQLYYDTNKMYLRGFILKVIGCGNPPKQCYKKGAWYKSRINIGIKTLMTNFSKESYLTKVILMEKIQH